MKKKKEGIIKEMKDWVSADIVYHSCGRHLGGNHFIVVGDTRLKKMEKKKKGKILVGSTIFKHFKHSSVILELFFFNLDTKLGF